MVWDYLLSQGLINCLGVIGFHQSPGVSCIRSCSVVLQVVLMNNMVRVNSTWLFELFLILLMPLEWMVSVSNLLSILKNPVEVFLGLCQVMIFGLGALQLGRSECVNHLLVRILNISSVYGLNITQCPSLNSFGGLWHSAWQRNRLRVVGYLQ